MPTTTAVGGGGARAAGAAAFPAAESANSSSKRRNSAASGPQGARSAPPQNGHLAAPRLAQLQAARRASRRRAAPGSHAALPRHRASSMPRAVLPRCRAANYHSDGVSSSTSTIASAAHEVERWWPHLVITQPPPSLLRAGLRLSLRPGLRLRIHAGPLPSPCEAHLPSRRTRSSSTGPPSPCRRTATSTSSSRLTAMCGRADGFFPKVFEAFHRINDTGARSVDRPRGR